MYWIQYAPASCRQWSKETLVCKSLVSFWDVSFLELCLVYFSLSSSKKVQAMSSGCGSWWYVRCCCSKFVYPVTETLDCHVPSGNNNHNKFIFFQKQRRPKYIKCKVTLLYYYYYIEIKASSGFHSVFLKSHCLYNYFNIQYLINVKLLFSALVFTIISYIIWLSQFGWWRFEVFL